MVQKLFSLKLMLVIVFLLLGSVFAEDKTQAPVLSGSMQKQIEDAIKVYGEKKVLYQKDVLELFERKEKFAREKGDLKTLNQIKKEKDAFLENGKDPTLFFITDQKRFLELAKSDLIKAYEKTIKDCVKMKLDLEAEGLSKELEEIKAGKTKTDVKVELKNTKPTFLEAPFSAETAKNSQMELAKSMGKLMKEQIDLGRGIKLEMVLIPAGKFVMGSPESEVDRKDNETQHEVTLTKPFYIGKYEVTQEQWHAVMGNNPSNIKVALLPVTNVSWNDCQDFIKKLNARGNGFFRLPTESEWEYACRAGTTTAYSFGENITPKDANFLDSKLGAPVVVGRYKPNNFGLFDMHGNVEEWCEDWYANYPTEPRPNRKSAGAGKSRILRGGAFNYNASFNRSSDRLINSPNERNHPQFGFRLVKTP